MYDVGSDPFAVKYFFDGPGIKREGEWLTPGWIQNQTGCASQYF